jgi:hypothetical protein
LKSAPVALDGEHAKEAVDRKWESDHGHAVAAFRYGAMSRPSPSDEPKVRPGETDRQRVWRLIEEQEREEDEHFQRYGYYPERGWDSSRSGEFWAR